MKFISGTRTCVWFAAEVISLGKLSCTSWSSSSSTSTFIFLQTLLHSTERARVLTWKVPTRSKSDRTFIRHLHTTCPVWSSSYLQPWKKLSVTALLQNQALQFPVHAAIPEAAHLHPDEQRWSQTLLLFHHTNTNRQLKSLCKTQLSGGCVSSSPLPLITASDWHTFASLLRKMDQEQKHDPYGGGKDTSVKEMWEKIKKCRSELHNDAKTSWATARGKCLKCLKKLITRLLFPFFLLVHSQVCFAVYLNWKCRLMHGNSPCCTAQEL